MGIWNWIVTNLVTLVVGVIAVILAIFVALFVFDVIGDNDDNDDKDQSNTGSNVGANVNAVECQVINDYPLELLPEIATSGSHLRVQFWSDGTPGEKETFLPANAADGGRFNLAQPLKGHVWEFQGCTDQQMRADADASTQRRLAGHADNRGFVDWTCTGLFVPSQGTQPTCNSSTTSGSTTNVVPAAPAAAPANPAPAAPAPIAPANPAPAPQLNCDSDGNETFQSQPGQLWHPAGEWRVINFWSNWVDPNYGSHKLILAPDQNVGLPGGGDSYSWPADCQQAAQDAFNNNGNPPASLSDLPDPLADITE